MHWHLNVTFREDANTTLDEQVAWNQNIIKKWSLSIQKTIEVKQGLSMKKKAICNQPLPNTVFRGSIIFLKILVIKVTGGMMKNRKMC